MLRTYDWCTSYFYRRPINKNVLSVFIMLFTRFCGLKKKIQVRVRIARRTKMFASIYFPFICLFLSVIRCERSVRVKLMCVLVPIAFESRLCSRLLIIINDDRCCLIARSLKSYSLSLFDWFCWSCVWIRFPKKQRCVVTSD